MDEYRLLSKGLNFIPTPEREDPLILLQDFLLLDRKLRLKQHFMERSSEDPLPLRRRTKFKENTGWLPSTQDTYIDQYKRATIQEILHHKIRNLRRPFTISPKENELP